MAAISCLGCVYENLTRRLISYSTFKKIFYTVNIIIYLHLGVLSQTLPYSEDDSYRIYGRCDDNATALGLKANIYALMNDTRKQLGRCNEDGIFDVSFPITYTHLIFEMKEYQTIKIPIHFTDDIPTNARFSIGNLASMTPLDSLNLMPSTATVLSIYFNVIDSIDIRYRLNSVKNLEWNLQGSFLQRHLRNKTTSFNSVPKGDYILYLTTTDGRLISSEEVELKSGVTFKSVRVIKIPEKTLSIAKTPRNSFAKSVREITNLYFNQSSYELRTEVKTTLDSITKILIKQPNLVAIIIGYTDNVGNRELNMSLSEYRAKSVENYLKLRNVPPDQIIAKWKGSDTKISSQDVEEVKARSRRVIIQLTPR